MLLLAVAAEFLVLALPLSMDMVLELGAATTGLFLMLGEDITLSVCVQM